jgi:uncharacterized protein YgiM (DUF1202 family)
LSAVRFEALLRSGIAAVTIAGVGAAFLILGVAAVSWRSQCASEPGAGICFGMPAEEAVTPDPTAGVPEVAPEAVAAAPAPELPVAEPVVADVVADVVVATTAAAPVAEPQPKDQLTEVAEMMASTFETLNAMKAAVNAAAVTGGPVHLPASEPVEGAAASDVEVALAEPMAVAEPAPPRAVAMAMAAPTAPTTRTVKVIPIAPGGLPQTSAATAAANAAAEPDPISLTDVAAAQSGVDALAFANTGSSVAATRMMTVNDNLVNVRSGPSTEAERVLVLKRGDEVKALAVAGDWVEVEVSEGRTGWMLGEFLTEGDLTGLPERDAAVETAATPEEPVATEPETELVAEVETTEATSLSGDVRTVRGAGVNVRSSPSSSSEKLFALPGGEQVSVTDTQRGWLQVTDDRGRSGWLYEDYVSGS